MYIVDSYGLAVLFCFITMICWGSWANTQKLAGSNWRYELFYWDYVLGVFLTSLLIAFTLGSTGEYGRPFLKDLAQAEHTYILSAFIGGVIFNAANILLSASISLVGMAVAFPVGIGLALVLGVLINYLTNQIGDPLILFIGVTCILFAVILNAIAYKKISQNKDKAIGNGLIVAVVAGVLMSLFYRFVAEGIDLANLENPMLGKMTPYTAVVVFSSGILISNLLFNTLLMKYSLTGGVVNYQMYFNGAFRLHFIGILGGAIWAIGNSLSFIAAGIAGPAISYGLGQGATLVSALWGVFIWKEFKGASRQVYIQLTLMFLLFVIGIFLIILAGNN